MNVRAHIPVDKAAFYEFVRAQAEGRFEYDRGLIVQQMTAGTGRHSAIAQRFVSVIERQLGTATSMVSSHGRGVDTSETVRQPDVVVEPMPTDWEAISTSVPSLLVEVLSPSTRQLDLNIKPGEYTSLATLSAYIAAEQDKALCYVWQRRADGNFPAAPTMVEGMGGRIEIEALGVGIDLAEIYRGLVAS